MHKDIRLALDAARQAQVPLPAALAADGVLGQAEKLGYGHRDIAGLFRVLADMAGAPGLADEPANPATGAATGPKAA